MDTIMNVLRKVLWLGRGTATVMGTAVMIAAVLGLATTALAAVPGDPFKLGRQNSVDALTRLVGSVDDAMLRVDNNSSGASATALELRVEPGQPPMKLDSDAKVGMLNADELDGQSGGAFLGVDAKAADADRVDGLDSGAFARARHSHDDRYYTESESDDRYVNKSEHTKAAHDALDIDADELDGKSADEIGVNGLDYISSRSDTNSDSPKVVRVECPFPGIVVGTGHDFFRGTSGNPPNEETDVAVYRVFPFLDRVTVEAYEEEPTSDEWSVTTYAVCARYGSSAP